MTALPPAQRLPNVAAGSARLLLGLLPLMAREWRHHPWRHGVALLAVALGVALAYSVHLINQSALDEFSTALRSANGEPDLTLRGQRAGFDDALAARVALAAGVTAASPVVEIDTYAPGADGQRVAVRVLGIDALQVAPLAAGLLPRPAAGADRLVFLDPDAVFLNPAARDRLGVADGQTLRLQSGLSWQTLRVAGSVPTGGAPLVVMDIAGAQAHFGMVGRLSRIDIRLQPGTDPAALLDGLALPPGVAPVAANDAEQRISNLSRAYRVNLTVLALVALFVGAFLVFSVVSLSVAQRTASFALLGVLGLTAGERRAMVLVECALLGALGSALGLLAGAGMALLALRVLAGDLGGGYFPGVTPSLRVDAPGAIGFGLLGTAAALVGGWLPARQAERLSPAMALKGLGHPGGTAPPAWPGLALLAAGAALAFAPPLGGLPLAAYGAVAALLFGGVALVPAGVDRLLSWLSVPGVAVTQHRPATGGSTHRPAEGGSARPPATRGSTRPPAETGSPRPSTEGAAPRLRAALRWLRRPSGSALWLLAVQRARFQRRTATAAVAGVVASLALSVALTVMVASFRTGVSGWLDSVLPADLYARTASSGAASDQAWLDDALLQRASGLPGVQRAVATRNVGLQLAPGRPAVMLIARPLDAPADQLPLLQAPLPPRPGEVGVYVSEAVVALYGAKLGELMTLPLGTQPLTARVLGVWRDYARQFGAIAIDAASYRRLTGDTRLNDLALWLQPGADLAGVQAGLRALMPDPSMLEFAATTELRAMSMRIFDRSFAVTYYLQAVAIAIGLVGVAASLSAQVLARRKEFGLLAHLGLTRREVIAIVAGEAAAWMAAGVLIGLLLGLAVSAVLVFVVNPQSFHWSMPIVLPWSRLALLCAAVLAAGVATAAWSARQAAGRSAVLSVKEDW